MADRGERGDTKSHHGRPREKETTFFIENLPEGVSNTMLWKAFSPFGIVSDAYVAKKKDARGNSFGFIRFIRVRDIRGDLVRLNTVKIKEAKLTVSLAKYDKNRSRNNMSYGGGQPGGAQWKPSGPMGFNQAWRQEGRSFRDVVGKKVKQPITSSKTLESNVEGALYPNHCLGRSIVGEAKDIKALKCLVLAINKEEKEVGLSYIGGAECLDRL